MMTVGACRSPVVELLRVVAWRGDAAEGVRELRS